MLKTTKNGKGFGNTHLLLKSLLRKQEATENQPVWEWGSKRSNFGCPQRCSPAGKPWPPTPLSPPSFLARFLLLHFDGLKKKRPQNGPLLKALFCLLFGLKPESTEPFQSTLCGGLQLPAPYTSPWFWWWMGGRESWGDYAECLSPWDQRPPNLLLNCAPFFGSWDGIPWPYPSPWSLLFIYFFPRNPKQLCWETMMSRGETDERKSSAVRFSNC